ncbi:MAG: PaaI family thioesterase [Schleiferiaceae bacterium]|nr:PaaI family thioesterase [Schleiferiaceae bacterium]MDR9442689.1 PaaI family thioesterase [Schleiferiaceae bacterium]
MSLDGPAQESLLERFNALIPGTLMETLQMRYVGVDPEAPMLQMAMPVGPAVHQPAGLLHGGVSAALAESVGSAASALLLSDPDQYHILGTHLQCHHLRSAREGTITATARCVHGGRTSHLWEIKVCDEQDKLLSHCHLTNRIIPK